MVSQLLELIQTHGYAFVLASVLTAQMGVPIPAFPVLVIAGAMVADGALSAPMVLAIAVFAALCGDLLWFQFGRLFGSRVLGWMCRLSLSPDRCVTDAERVFARFGLKSLLVTRFLPGLAAIAPSLAGLSGYRRSHFAIFDAMGGAIWAGLALVVGYAFHHEVDRTLAALERFGTGALGFVLALLGLFIGWKAWRRYRVRLAAAVPRMSVEELRRLLDLEPPPLVIDLRGPALRAAEPSPVAGTRGIDDAEHEPWADWLPRDRDVVVVCACPKEASAAAVAATLRKRGWPRAFALAGGFTAWPVGEPAPPHSS